MTVHIVQTAPPFFGWVDLLPGLLPAGNYNQPSTEVLRRGTTDPNGMTYDYLISASNNGADGDFVVNPDGTILIQRADAGLVGGIDFAAGAPFHNQLTRITMDFQNGFHLFVGGTTTVISHPVGAADSDPAGSSIGGGDGEWIIEITGFGWNISGDDAGAAPAGSSLLIKSIEIDTRITGTA